MALSDEDKTRIEEEEYRKMARERLERTVRLEADIRSRGDQRLEVRGVGTEIYRDVKRGASTVGAWMLWALSWLVMAGSAYFLFFTFYALSKEWSRRSSGDIALLMIVSLLTVLPGVVVAIFKVRRLVR